MDNELCNCLHLRHFHTPGCNGGSPDADTTGKCRAERLKWYGILIDGNSCTTQGIFSILACHFQISQIDNHHVIVGAIGNEFDTVVHQMTGKSPCIFNGIFLVGIKRLTQSFLESNRFGGNNMHEWSALDTGKYFFV